MTLPGNLSRSEVLEKYRDRQDRDEREYGTDGYNGTFSTCRAPRFYDKSFPTVDEAITWLDDVLNKRESAAVRAKDVRKVVAKRPTFNGEVAGLYGEPWSYRNRSNGFTPADQLNNEEKDKLKKLYDEWSNCRVPFTNAKNAFGVLYSALNDLTAEFTSWKELKAARAVFVKEKARYDKAAVALNAFDQELKEKLYGDGVEDRGEVWVIAGLASS